MPSGKKSKIAPAEAPASGVRNARRRRNKSKPQAAEAEFLSAPVAVSQMQVSRSPVISQRAKSVRIAHRELILDTIHGKETFTVTGTFYANPGMPDYFPWLSTQAEKWECYRFNRLRLVYVSSCPSSTAGSIILSPDYDVSDQVPETPMEAENNIGSVSDSVWKSVTCTLDPAAMSSLGPRKFVRSSAIAGDPKTFDAARVIVASYGCAAGNGVIGKLYADYDVELFSPQMYPRSPLRATTVSSFHEPGPVNALQATYLALTLTGADDPLRIKTADATVFYPPAGVYRLDVTLTATTTVNGPEDFTISVREDGVLPVGNEYTARNMSAGLLAGFVKYRTLTCIIRTDGDHEYTVYVYNACGNTETVGNVQMHWTLI